MKHSLYYLTAGISMFVACQQQPLQEAVPRPVKVSTVQSLDVMEKNFSGIVSPDQFSDLAFKMSGPLISLHVVEGQKVRTGQVVAELDPQDFKWEFEAKKASFQTAEAQLQRSEKLLAKQAVSQQEHESVKASYANARAAYEYAQNTLEQTKLRAPFDGFIQKKYVENYQKVQPGQAIVCLINPNQLQIQFTMPETNLAFFSLPYTIYSEFDNYKGKLFRTKVKEYVEASPDGSGVPVFLYIDDPDFNLNDYKIAVGFSCRVLIRVQTGQETAGKAVVVPLTSIVADEASDALYVFTYSDGKVGKCRVTDAGMQGKDQVIVTGDLKPGQQVVTAGATRLVDNQTVKVLTD